MLMETRMKTLFCTVLLSLLLPLKVAGTAELLLSGDDLSGKSLLVAFADERTAGPGAPTKLTLDVVPPALYLEWKLSPQDPGMVTGYEIMRAMDYRGPYHKIATVNKGISHYEDASVSPKVIYFYKVRAVSEDSYSPYSNVAVGDVEPY
jgi:hypothetical protein